MPDHILLDDNFVEELVSMIHTPTEQKQAKLNKSFEKFYRQSPKKKVIEIVAGLVSSEFVAEKNVVNSAKDFSLNNSAALGNDVQHYLERGGR